MTASEKIQKMVDNDELTEEQQDSMVDFNVFRVDEARGIFKEMLNNENKGVLSDVDIITTLYNLLKYSSDDYVVCEGYNGTVELLDDDTLDDILDA